MFAAALTHQNVLIGDQSNELVLEVDRNHKIVWQYGQTGKMGAGFDQLNNPATR